MNPDAEFDIIVYGASGFTGRYGVAGSAKRVMAGQSASTLAQLQAHAGLSFRDETV